MGNPQITQISQISFPHLRHMRNLRIKLPVRLHLVSVIAKAAIFAGLTNLDCPRKPPRWAAPARGQIPLYRKTPANPHNQPKNTPLNRPIR
jgi:hypothetical protein